MDNIMILKISIVILVGLLIYFFLIMGIFRDGKQLKKSYMELLYRSALKKNAENIVNLIRAESFFRMTNDGDDPCDLDEEIGYIDYIKECNMYIKGEADDKYN